LSSSPPQFVIDFLKHFRLNSVTHTVHIEVLIATLHYILKKP
jgi:hypothetical protein